MHATGGASQFPTHSLKPAFVPRAPSICPDFPVAVVSNPTQVPAAPPVVQCHRVILGLSFSVSLPALPSSVLSVVEVGTVRVSLPTHPRSLPQFEEHSRRPWLAALLFQASTGPSCLWRSF